jgi:hypothetical protein
VSVSTSTIVPAAPSGAAATQVAEAFERDTARRVSRLGAGIFWLARIAITWGVLAMAMLFVRDLGGFVAVRFLLGVAEAGYLPGVIYYLSHGLEWGLP